MSESGSHYVALRYLVQLLAHLVGFGHHGHQFDVVIEDGQQTGICLTGSNTGLTWMVTNVTHRVSIEIIFNIQLLNLLLTQVDALSSSQFRVEVVIVVAAPVISTPLRRETDEKVGAI